MTRVKICGITNLDDALFAAQCGADALGFVFYEESPRHITIGRAKKIIEKLPPFVSTVGVFVDEKADMINRAVSEASLACVQLHGSETPDECGKVNAKVIKAFRIKEGQDMENITLYEGCAILLDAYSEKTPGGAGMVFDWDMAVEAKRFGNIILAGGLTPENVIEAIRRVLPYGVDVASGVEASPGKKDSKKVEEFIRRVRSFSDEEIAR